MNLRRFTNRTRKDQDLAEEIESHLPMHRTRTLREAFLRKKPVDRLTSFRQSARYA